MEFSTVGWEQFMRWSLQGNLYIGLTNIISHSEMTYISCERPLTCRRTAWLLWSPIMGSQQNLDVRKPNTLPGNNTLSLMMLSPRSVSKATGLARSNYMFEKCLCSFFLLLFVLSKRLVIWTVQQTGGSSGPKQKGNCKMQHLAMCIMFSLWLDILKVGESRICSQL